MNELFGWLLQCPGNWFSCAYNTVHTVFLILNVEGWSYTLAKFAIAFATVWYPIF